MIILSYIIDFDLEALKSTKEDYVKIKVTPDQAELIHQISFFLFE